VTQGSRGRGGLAVRVSQTLAFRVAGLVFSLVASIVTARLLGPALRGELVVMLTIPALLAAVSLMGADNANLYFSGRSELGHPRVVRYSLIHAFVGGTVVVVAGLIIATFVPGIRLGLSEPMFAVALAMTPVALLISLLGTAEAGRGRAPSVAALTAAGLGVWALIAAAVGALGNPSPLLLFAAFCVAQLAVGIALLIRSGRPGLAGAFGWPQYASYALRTNLPALAMLLLLRVDIPAIQLLAGPREVGLYSIVLPMAESLMLISTAVNVVVLPGVANGSIDVHRALRVTHVAVAASALAALALAATAPFLVPGLFGAPFADAVPLLWVLLPGIVVFTAGRSLQIYLLGSGNIRASAIAAIAALAVCIVGDLVLVPGLGAMGAAAATTAAYVVFATIETWAVVRGTGVGWRAVLVPGPAFTSSVVALVRRARLPSDGGDSWL